MEDKNFYVYIYLDPRKPGNYVYGEFKFDYEPFYVGKGSFRRLKDHIMNCRLKSDKNKLKTNKIKKIIRETNRDPIIIKFKEILNLSESLILEKKIVETIGRINLKTGPLVNLTNGGSPGNNFIFKKTNFASRKKSNTFKRVVSEETRRRLRESHLGKKDKPETIEKKRISATGRNLGKKYSAELKTKLSNSHVKQKYIIFSPTGQKYETNNLKRFGRENNINSGRMAQVSLGKEYSCGGWIVYIVGKEYLRKEIEEKYNNRKKFLMCSPDGIFYENIENLKNFCKEFNIKYRSVIDTIYRKKNFVKNWYVEKI